MYWDLQDEIGKGVTWRSGRGAFSDVRDLKELLVNLFQSVNSLLKLEVVGGKLGLHVRFALASQLLRNFGGGTRASIVRGYTLSST